MLEKIKEILLGILGLILGIVGCFMSAIFEVIFLIVGILGVIWLFGLFK